MTAYRDIKITIRPIFASNRKLRCDMNKYLKRSITGILILALFLLAVFFELFYHADMLVCDNTYRQLESQTRDVKIITIDEKTEAEYGKYETYIREKSAELIELLSKDPESSPAVIAFDIMFIGEDNTDTDKRLAEAAASAGNVVCASNLVYTGRMEEDGGKLVYNSAAIDREEKPFDALSAVSAVGFANTSISGDNIIRYAQLYADTDEGRLDSLAYTAYKVYAEKCGFEINEPSTVSGKARFFYSGKPGAVPHVSLADVLEGRVPVSEFDDCLVFIGVYAPGFRDSYNAAVSRGQQMYGVEINANIVLALMKNKIALNVPTALYATVAAVLLFVWIYLLEKQKLWVIISEAAVLIGAHLLLGRVLAHSGLVISQVYFLAAVVLAVLWFIIRKYIVEKIRRRQALGTLKKYVAPQIVDKLAVDGKFELHLGGERRHIAVLFVDVRGFTTMSESLTPEEVVSMLNKYLSITTRAVFSNEGTLDKFIGDATMAVFNAPFDLEDYIFKAVKTAWDIQQGVIALGKTMDKPINVGVGVNCGDAVVGNIGCDVRMDYTAIGDTVNTAARLESNAKAGQILISEVVYNEVRDRIIAEPVGEHALKGKVEKVKVFNVTGFVEENKEG